MTKMDELKRSRAALSTAMATYGADRGRWPAGTAAQADAVLSNDRELRRELAEAEALDRVLAAAPLVGSASANRLADRIMAAAAAEPVARPRPVAAGTVVDLDARRRRAAPMVGRRAIWQVAGALAASLVVGLFTGAAGLLDGSGSGLADMLGLQSDNDAVATLLGQEFSGVGDEDTL